MSVKLAVLIVTATTVASVIQGQPLGVDGECHSQVGLNSSFEERVQLHNSGLYVYPDPISCNGTLTSWIVCGHFDNDTNISTYVYRRRVFGKFIKFELVNWTEIHVTPQNMCANIDVSEPQRFPVLVGDMIAVACDTTETANQCSQLPLFFSNSSTVCVIDKNSKEFPPSFFSKLNFTENMMLTLRAGVEKAMVPDSTSASTTIVVCVIVSLASSISLVIVVLLVCAVVKRRKKSQDTDVDGATVPVAVHTSFRNRALLGSNVYSHSYEIPTTQGSQMEAVGDIPDYEIDDGNFWEPASKEDELISQLSKLHVPLIKDQDLQIGEYLGSGQFGTVNKGVWHTSEEKEVAVKSLPAGSSEDERVKFLQEAAITGQFKHPSIVRLYAITTLPQLRIVLELLLKGDLRHYLKSLRPPPGSSAPPELPAILLSFCRQVAGGMSYLSNKGFIHRDLAARNILISQNCVCKIADFGLSRDLQYEDFYTSHGGKIPVKWTAPEALNYRQYSTASDVWSYGILLYEIWSLGEKPYKDCTNQEVVRRVSSGFRLAPPSGCPKSVYEIMISCWNPSADHRPNFPNILVTLQQPDFQLLQLSSEHSPAGDERARSLGEPVETAKELYKDLQQTYIVSSDVNTSYN